MPGPVLELVDTASSAPKLRPTPPAEDNKLGASRSTGDEPVGQVVVDPGVSARTKARELIVEKQRHSGHTKSDTLRLFESHADVVDGTIVRSSFKHVILERLRLGLDETELDLLYSVLGPDGEDRVQLSRVVAVLHTKERQDPRKHFPKAPAVDPVLLGHYRSTVPCLSGASHEQRAAPPGAGRAAPSPEAREEFRSEVAANMKLISARKEQQRQRDQLQRMGEMTLAASLSRHRLPAGTADMICGASTSRQWPRGSTSPRGAPKVQSAREGPVAALQFLSASSGDLVSVSASPLNSPRRDFSAELLPTPGSPRAGFKGVPGVRVPPKHHYEQPAGAQMDPPWITPKGGRGPNTAFSKGQGWNLQPTPKTIYTKEFQSTLSNRAQEHDSQAVSQTIGTLRRRREHFAHGTRFFDPRTEYGCQVEINPNGLMRRSFGDKEGHRFIDELPKRNSWNPSIMPAPALPGHQSGVFGYEDKSQLHPKQNPKVHWNTMVETGASEQMLASSARPWGPKTRMKRLMQGTLGSPTMQPMVSTAQLSAKVQFMTEHPPQHAQNFRAVAVPIRSPRNGAGDIGSGYFHGSGGSSPQRTPMNIAAIGQLLSSN